MTTIGVPIELVDLDAEDFAQSDVVDSKEEEWIRIQGHETFQVSNLGRIKSKSGRIFRAPQVHQKYIRIVLNEGKSYSIHRLVAIHFVKNDDPVGKRYVDHIDGNKFNNMAANLRWCTHQQNMIAHQPRVKRRLDQPCLVKLRKSQNDDWLEFPCKKDAASHFGVTASAINHPNSLYEFRWVNDVRSFTEEFRQIPGEAPFSNYQITRSGVVNRIGDNRLAVGTNCSAGYKRAKLCWNNEHITEFVHKLVMLTWGPPQPSAEYRINHINGIRDDNRLENLEWSTQSENSQHAWDTGLIPKTHRGRETHKYDLDGTFLETLEKSGEKVAAYLSIVRKFEDGEGYEGRSKPLQCQGYLWSHEKVAELDTNNYEAIRNTFPDFDPDIHLGFDLDVIRKYVNDIDYPISHFDIDGTFLKVYPHATDLTVALHNRIKKPTTWFQYIIKSDCPESIKLRYFGYIRRATIEDIFGITERDEMLYRFSYTALQEVLKPKSITGAQVEIAPKVDEPDVEIDWDFVRYVLNTRGGRLTRPVLQWTKDGNGNVNHVRRWRSANDTNRSYPESSIQQVVDRQEAGKRSYADKYDGYLWKYTDFKLVESSAPYWD